jgi:hypothetical protein
MEDIFLAGRQLMKEIFVPVMHQVESKREEQALAYDQEVDEAAGLSEA